MWPLENEYEAHARLYNNAKTQRDKIERMRQEEREKHFPKTGAEYALSQHEAEESAKRLHNYANIKRDRLEFIRDLEKERDTDRCTSNVRTEFEADESTQRMYRQATYIRDKIERLRQDARDDHSDSFQEGELKTMNEREREESTSRLYDKSLKMQAEGLKRRMEIEQKHAKRAPTPSKKISAENATRLYDRGMVHKIKIEMMREQAGNSKDYVSPLLDPLISDQSKAPIKTTSDKNTTISRIRPRSRLRTNSPAVHRHSHNTTLDHLHSISLPPVGKSSSRPLLKMNRPSSSGSSSLRTSSMRHPSSSYSSVGRANSISRQLSKKSASARSNSMSDQSSKGFTPSSQSPQNGTNPQQLRRSRSFTASSRGMPNVRTRSPTPVRTRRCPNE